MPHISRRTFIGAVGSSPFVVVGVGSQSVSADDVIYAEDFENLDDGDVPSEYVLAGNDDQGVDASTAAVGEQAYRMSGSHGGCWRALARCPIELADEMVIEGSFKVGDGEPGCHSGTGAINFRTEASESWSDGSGTRVLRFYPDETVNSGGETVAEYDKDDWNTFTVVYSRNRDDGTVTHECQVNGGDVTTVTRDEDSHEDDLSALEIRSGDYTVYWDDLLITEGTVTDTPQAAISVEPTDPVSGESITFDASDSSGDIDSYEWDFGDGETATGVEVTHEYDEPGEYAVELRVSDGDQTDDTTETIAVEDADDDPTAPTAVITYEPETPEPTEIVTFDASDSSGEIESYEWEFDDHTESGNEIEQAYDEPGEYEVTLTVDGPAGTDTVTETIVVEATTDDDDELEAVIDAPETVLFSETVTVDAGDSRGDIDSYEWDFGDATTATGETAEHQYDEPGEYILELFVEGEDESDVTTEQIVVEAEETHDDDPENDDADDDPEDSDDADDEPEDDHADDADDSDASDEAADGDGDDTADDNATDEHTETDDDGETVAIEVETDEIPGFGALAAIGGLGLALTKRFRNSDATATE